MKNGFKKLGFIILALLLSSGIMYSQTNFWESTNGVNGSVVSMTITSNGDIWAGGDSNNVYLSTDNGNTWSSFSIPTIYPYHVTSIAVNPANGYIFASAFDGLYRSTNNGVNWELVYSGYTVYDILITQSEEIYLGLSPGISRRVIYSSDMGNTWINKNTGLPSETINCLLQETDGTLYAGTTNRGVYISTNGGDNWSMSSRNTYTTATVLGLTIANDGSIFATTTVDGILRSTNKGSTWIQVLTGMYFTSDRIICSPKTGYIFANNNAISPIVYRSTDLGAKWYKIHNGLPINEALSVLVPVRALVVNPTTGMVFAGYGVSANNSPSINPSIYRSTDKFDNIINLNVEPTYLDFGRVPIYSYKDSAVYITNTGETDIVITVNIIHLNYYFPSSFSFFFKGAVTLKPNETYRLPVSYRLPDIYMSYTTRVTIMEVTTDAGGTALLTLAATATVPISSVEEIEEIPTTYNLMQNYPNPFNPATKIQYSLPEATHVRLSVYNSIGQEVMQLVNENQTAGKYIVDFDAQNLQSGVYFYKLQTGKFVETKKMLLIK
jgi:hypothetical protein